MDVPKASACKSPLDPPFCKGGKRRARGDLRELAVSFVITKTIQNVTDNPGKAARVFKS